MGHLMIDQLKYNFSDLPLYNAPVAQVHADLSRLMDTLQLDVLVITSQDEYLTEYLPSLNNQRYALSGFDGSAGSGLFLSEAAARRLGVPQFVLFVDGRYHLQAEKQCDPAFVQVEKVSLNGSIWQAITDWFVLHKAELERAGYDSLRMSVAQRQCLLLDTQALGVQWTSLANREIDQAISLPGWRVERPIFEVPQSTTGMSIAENIAMLNKRIREHVGEPSAKTAFLSCMADDASYLLNSRGYHLPYTSSHLGFVFVVDAAAVLFLPEGVDRCPVEIGSYPMLTVIRRDIAELERFLAQFDVEFLCYGFDAANCALPDVMRRIWPGARHVDYNPIEAARASKTPEVLAQFRDAFARSSAAIAEVMRWAKTGEPGRTHSEYDLARMINDAYGARGAVSLSFTSIAANGANSASAHYAAASADVELTEGELVLLDSGAYYDGGFATDCTRVVLRRSRPDTQAQPWQREIYTVALKACIKGLVTHFPKDASGADVDAAVREVCRKHGYDYAHGTGHGVGIHVHESGVRFSPASSYGLVPNAVISIEPGIYLPGKGGVRIENIVVIHPSETEPDKVTFENLVTVGYDWDLIDLTLLTDGERAYLREYERACVERGTHVTACPLL